MTTPNTLATDERPLSQQKDQAMDSPNIAFCDGGLCNRLNSLLFCLVLKHRFGHDWRISWPTNNWCGSRFERLFSSDLPHDDKSINHYRSHQDEYRLLMHENQGGFRSEAITLHRGLTTFDEYKVILDSSTPALYYHSLLPPFVTVQDIAGGLTHLHVNAEVHSLATEFCRLNNIDGTVLGLHIRKTDFGGMVDDNALFNLAANSEHRFFVCSDDPQVNARFAALPNCSVFEKKFFPRQLVDGKGWNAVTTDNEGRCWPFNIDRPEDAIVEALVDLLILSRTRLVNTSPSTFLRMAMILNACRYF